MSFIIMTNGPSLVLRFVLKKIAAVFGYANLYASLDRAHVMAVATPLSQCNKCNSSVSHDAYK